MEMPISGELIAGALASLAFVGCSLTTRATPQAQGRRREVVVNGRRVKTVDIHAHTIVPEAAAVINHPLEAPGLLWSNVSDRIQEMDAEGIDVEALSINPYWYRAERDAAAELIKIQNEKLAEFCAATPDRFVAFATVALQHPDLGAERPPQGQRPPDQHDRQPARNHDRLVAPDLRGHARPLSGLENLCGAWRRLPAVLCRALGCGDHNLPEPGRSAAEEKADPIPE